MSIAIASIPSHTGLYKINIFSITAGNPGIKELYIPIMLVIATYPDKALMQFSNTEAP